MISDLSSYTVIQEITKQSTDLAQKPAEVMAIHYHFTTSPADALSPFALNDDLEVRACAPPLSSPASDAVTCSLLFSREQNIDYETDEAPGYMSTCSDGAYASDRSSSPSYSTPSGFQSLPLSPTDWVPGQDWASVMAAQQSQVAQFAYGYGLQSQPQYSPPHSRSWPPTI